MYDFRNSPLGNHISAVRPRLRSHLNNPVRFGKNLSIMIHQHDRVAVGNQVVHHSGQPDNIGRVQANRRLVQHI